MERPSISRFRGDPDKSMVRVDRYKTVPGKRAELVALLPNSRANRHILGRDVVIWAEDPLDDDALFRIEYWSSLEELQAGSHSEATAGFFHFDAKDLIAEGGSMILEASPVWGMGVPPPAGSKE